MIRLLSTIMILLVTTGGLFTSAVNYEFTPLTHMDGLSQNSITCISQDHKGYLWVGTIDGLNRYDGHGFDVYRNDPLNPNSLSNNLIQSIMEDQRGNLWVGTQNGLNRINLKSGQIRRYYLGTVKVEITGIKTNSKGEIWIGTTDGVYHYDYIQDRFHSHPIFSEEGFSKEVTGFCRGFGQKNLIIVNGEPFEFDQQQQGFVRVRGKYAFFKSLGDEKVVICFKDSIGLVWTVSWPSGLIQFDPVTGKREVVTPYFKPVEWGNDLGVYSLIETKTGDILFGLYRGIGIYHRSRREFTFVKPYQSEVPSVNTVRAVWEDQHGVFWLGTYGGGLVKMRSKRKIFHPLIEETEPMINLKYGSVHAIYRDSLSRLWLGTSSGLKWWDESDQKFRWFTHNPEDDSSLPDNNVCSITEDKYKRLWVGTQKGLCLFLPETGKFLTYLHDSHHKGVLRHRYIRTLFLDKAGRLWIGTRKNGLYLYNYDTNDFSHYGHDPEKADSLSHNYVCGILQDTRGDLWIGTVGGGLNRFKEDGSGFVSYHHQVNRPESLSHDEVLSLAEDRDGRLWVGTSNGLNLFRSDSGSFTRFFDTEGLPNNTIYGILVDEHNHLWMSTNMGLSQFKYQTGQFRNFTKSDGLINNEFNKGASYKDINGRFYFGGVVGLSSFDPRDILPSSSRSSVLIKSIYLINGEKLAYQPYGRKMEIVVGYKDNSMTINYSVMDFRQPKLNNFAFFMEGVDSGWRYVKNQSSVIYSNLSPGSYQFKVMGSNFDGIWDKKGDTLKITIIPPFWKTLWFKILAVVFALGFLLVYYRYKTVKIRERFNIESERKLKFQKINYDRKSLKNEMKLRSDFTAMLVHDLKSPLNAVRGYGKLMIEEPDKVDVNRSGSIIYRSTGSMLNLINNMLDISKIEAGKLVLLKKRVFLVDILEDLLDIMDPLITEKTIILDREFADLPSLEIDDEKIGQVLHNLIGNAIKFSPVNGRIEIRLTTLTLDESVFQRVSVADQGRGIRPDQEKYLFDKYTQFHQDQRSKGTGLGLAVSKLIVTEHNGTIGYRRTADGYSEFHFLIPE